MRIESSQASMSVWILRCRCYADSNSTIKVSSVMLIGAMRVRFYEHRQYRGRSILIEGGVERPGRNTERQILVVACFAARAPGATWAGTRRSPTGTIRAPSTRMRQDPSSNPAQSGIPRTGTRMLVRSLGLPKVRGSACPAIIAISRDRRHFNREEPRFRDRGNGAFSAIVVRGR